MTISRNDQWIRIAALNERDEILFTLEVLEIMGEPRAVKEVFLVRILAFTDPHGEKKALREIRGDGMLEIRTVTGE